MRWYWTLAAAAFVVLGAAAVWMGGLNQDEGWYLYAANLVAEGQLPYRDFFFTQGPVLPYVYSAFAGIWKACGLLGARVFTFALGALGILFAVALARRLVPVERKGVAGVAVLLLLGSNLYHLYYVAIPKTYALAGLFVIVGFYLLSFAESKMRGSLSALAGLSLAFAAGTRISLGALLAVAGLWLLLSRQWRAIVGFTLGGLAGLALVYLPFLCDAGSREGLLAAQAYHAARGGFDPIWVVGSMSRLVRWYLPVFIVLGLGIASAIGAGRTGRTSGTSETNRTGGAGRTGRTSGTGVLLCGFLAVFAVQMLAPFPYEDYQVPIMALLAVYATVALVSRRNNRATEESEWSGNRIVLLVLGMCFANSFGSPLLEKWSVNGQDRFWSLKKEKYELAQLRDVAKRIEGLDPGGKMLLTQDLYLAVETGRKVPKGLEMGPFSMLSDEEWRRLLSSAPSEIAALSGYSFAIEPPVCNERSIQTQMEYWGLLKEHYELVERQESFGQNATTLLILKRK